jgi:ATP-dependent DNA helicase DinG
MNFNFDKFFPYESIRAEQKRAIEHCLDQYINQNKRFVVVEAGTGCGKSAIGLTVGRFMNFHEKKLDENYVDGTYFVTTQKILQDQYSKDFGKSMCSLKSSSNYRCSFSKKLNCQESQRALAANPDKKSAHFKSCTFNCVYKKTKKEFLESQESVTNFPYFLTEAAYSGKVVPRKFMVVDEAHNIEDELSRFVEVTVSQRFCESAIKEKWPVRKTQQFVYKWIRDSYFPTVQIKLTHFEQQLENMGLKSKIKELESLQRQYEMLSSHVEKLSTFLKGYDKDNWILEVVEPEGRSKEKFVFRPIDVAPFAEQFINRLGKRVLFMSATILDKTTFCSSLGLKPSEVSFISIPTPFPVENRPIIFSGVGSMSAKAIVMTLPQMAKAVRQILKEHKGQKGIIHCHTYRVANYLKKHVRSNRLLVHDSSNRDEVLEKHKLSRDATVLLSPSMAEGVDLKGDASRFQIICKVPYPYLGDKIVKKRMYKFPDWYPLQVAKTVVQSVGRSIRNSEDQAVTYILDSDWERFYRRHSKMFPQSFKDSVL